MSSTVKPKPEPAVSLKGSPDHRAAQMRAAVSKGTPKGMPVQPSFRGMPSTFVYGDDGYARINGSIAAGRGSAAVGPGDKPYKWLPSVTPLSPNTAIAQALGGQVGAGVRNYMGGKHEQAIYAMNPLQGLRNAVAQATARDLTPQQRAAGASAGAVQTVQQGAMLAPILQAAVRSFKARSPLPLLSAVAKTYGATAYGDAPVELAQRYAGLNPDSASSQRAQGLVTSRLMAALSGGAASRFLRIAPLLNAGSEVVRGVQRGTTGAATPDYTKLQSLPAGASQVLDDRATTGLERRQLGNVIRDVDQPALKRLTALAMAGIHGVSSPLSVVDGWSEANRGQSALQELKKAPVSSNRSSAEWDALFRKNFEGKFKNFTEGDQFTPDVWRREDMPDALTSGNRNNEMDVLYRNMFSGKQRDFTWPGEAKPGLWTRDDMPDRVANDTKRWGTPDEVYDRSFHRTTSPVVGDLAGMVGSRSVHQGLRLADLRTSVQKALRERLYANVPAVPEEKRPIDFDFSMSY